MISPELSFQFALLPAVGGLGTAIGPVLGSFADHAAVGAAALLFRQRRGRPASCRSTARVLIVVMLYFPSGIAGALQRLADAGEGAAMTTLLEVRNAQPHVRRPQWRSRDVSFSVAAGRTARPDRAERRGQEHALQSDRRRDRRRPPARSFSRTAGHRLEAVSDRARRHRAHLSDSEALSSAFGGRERDVERLSCTTGPCGGMRSARAIAGRCRTGRLCRRARRHTDGRPAQAAGSRARAGAAPEPRAVRRDHGRPDADAKSGR